MTRILVLIFFFLKCVSLQTLLPLLYANAGMFNPYNQYKTTTMAPSMYHQHYQGLGWRTNDVGDIYHNHNPYSSFFVLQKSTYP
ncbi:uncharacterized protein CELE_T01B7.13 [Caenorhabditis elegans]|uniref:Secreted protein n=1 Tax=Caenorhabditis elegans TaxID=6239 RepID=G1K0W8_CAEEL|nr:Secreted protein [Caenorhabditis elegans]CCC42194.2 Secreted protein [Caenorhabditis elegans]|eukprot:NP_001254183.2 Uncharacterized protein CELE_T01B7.13 [Caenorhabditis elegans]